MKMYPKKPIKREIFLELRKEENRRKQVKKIKIVLLSSLETGPKRKADRRLNITNNVPGKKCLETKSRLIR
jgi:hypothetical protein